MKNLSSKNAVYLTSEALKKINYDERKHILEATFSNKRTYQYKKVPATVWAELINIIQTKKSAGAYFNTTIKPFYDCVEII